MSTLNNMIIVEWRKAIRSRIPYWTSVFAAFLPMAIAMMVLIARNPEISQKLGILSAKADLIAFSATNWTAYMALTGEIIAAAGFFMFVVILSWIFGREFADGTLKDMLAVPVERTTILMAKVIVFGGWSFAMSLITLTVSLLLGSLIQLPDGSTAVIVQGILGVAVTTLLTVLVVIPFALLASAGRGYLLPMSMAVLTLILANVAAALGRGDLFPWSIPGLYSQGKELVGPAGFWIVVVTGLLGWYVTDLWWKKSDQSR
ncbi:ABC transporter permease [Leptolinea sp. HRD-7]|nr:ABC transporter permease [Leptolinea sp. HRD-7]